MNFRGEQLGWIVQFLAKFAPDIHRELNRVVVQDNTVVFELEIKGTFTGPYESPAGVLQPNGAKFKVPGADFWVVENGKIKQFNCHVSVNILLEQMGVQAELSRPQSKLRQSRAKAEPQSRWWIAETISRDPRRRPSPDAPVVWVSSPQKEALLSEIMNIADVLIVGGGSAGAVLAARLSEDPGAASCSSRPDREDNRRERPPVAVAPPAAAITAT